MRTRASAGAVLVLGLAGRAGPPETSGGAPWPTTGDGFAVETPSWTALDAVLQALDPYRPKPVH